MRRTPHRLLRGPLAAAVAAAGLLGLLTAVPQARPAPTSEPVASSSAAETTATVFYSAKTRDWSAYYLHYSPDGGSWTNVPGTRMEAACAGWAKLTVPLGGRAD